MANTKSKHNQKVRLFILESPGPFDALEGRSEGPALSHISKLIGHKVAMFPVHSASQFEEFCDFIASMADYKDLKPETPICIHISAHGTNGSGLSFGGDDVTWEEVKVALSSIFERVKCPVNLVLSACNANDQKITTQIEQDVCDKKKLHPPEFVFCSTGNVSWSDAAVGWTVFYHLLPKVNLKEPKAVQEMLKKIKSIGLPKLWYYRWNKDSHEYRRYENDAKTA